MSHGPGTGARTRRLASPPMGERLLVIGGDAGGMTAATNARKHNPELDIVVVEKTRWVSYTACGIPYHIGGDVDSLDELVARTAQELRDRNKIDVRLRHEPARPCSLLPQQPIAQPALTLGPQ